MEAEICEQPAALANNSQRYFDKLGHLRERGPYDMVLIAARGSSDHAAMYARYLVEVYLGIPVSLAAPSVFTRYKADVKYPKCLCVGISQSGAAPDVAEVLDCLKAKGQTTLAITNTPNSKLTKVADHTLVLDVGPETSLPATKTYSASLLALYQLVRGLGGALSNPSATPTEAWVEQTRSAAVAAAPIATSRQPLFALARGFNFCTALEQALKLMECALISCKGYSIADFEHGPKALVDKRTGIISFGPVEPGEATVIRSPATPEEVPEALRPIWDSFFAQWLALECARIMGVDPDNPPNLSKITRTL
jgi:glutamine---fructose-6-phosphate transaminase (isomerizing)